MPLMTYTVRVSMIIKAESQEDAKRMAEDRLLNELSGWFIEDPRMPPYPAGSLLHYSILTLPSEVDEDVASSTPVTSLRLRSMTPDA